MSPFFPFEAHHNLGSALLDLGHLHRAVECYERALELNPDLADAHSNLAQTLLLFGNFERGWQGYEWRWRTGELPAREYGKPRWNGEVVEGKTMLVWAEQGLGDTLQFARYLRMVKGRGAKTLFECPRLLAKLLTEARTCEMLGVDELVPQGEALPPFDFHIPLASLPRILQTKLDTIPANIPYLFPNAGLVGEWGDKLRSVEGFRVGINWRGRGGQGSHRKRDIPVEMFERLVTVPGVRMISLQKSEVEDQRSGEFKVQGSKFKAEMEDRTQPSPSLALRACVEERTQPAIVDLGEIDTEHGAFMDTAAIMMNLDLVITSDTSVAHLAGALGVPVWVALPFVPDWRWLLDRSDSPWYPTMRLFRQKRLGDWKGVFGEIEAALRERVQSSRFEVKGQSPKSRSEGMES